MYLAVDIGGTKVVVAFAEATASGLALKGKERFASREHASLEDIVRAYLARAGHGTPPAGLRSVGIGVAGPVVGRRASVTNLPWEIDADALQRELGAPVRIVNDLEAHAYGIVGQGSGGAAGAVSLNAGRPSPGNAALIAAGTGLGQAILFWDGQRHAPSASEGGHTSFAPRTADEIELLQFLVRRYEHVSWERVVSGADGFRNLYDFLLASRRISVPDACAAALAQGDIGEAITTYARDGHAFADTVLQWFCRLYGAEAGNLALKALALAGVYVGGGIVGKILPWMERGDFMEAFTAKGRFRGLLADVPVLALTDEDLGLKGAAAVAKSLA